MGNALTVGQIYAGYRIERTLGQGGFGEVYLARDRQLPRLIALKLLTKTKIDANPSDNLRRRFEREADLIAPLQHPNIVPIYDRGETDGHLWISMAYVDGSDLRSVLRMGYLRATRAVHIVTQIAAALDFAFEQAGAIHRDVKPANILLTTSTPERAILTDFGIAKALNESTLTPEGGSLATFQYAAPEIFTDPKAIDRRIDVYALGITFFAMITGRLPYLGQDPAALMHEHVLGDIPLPQAIEPTLPEGLNDVIKMALAKDRSDRYPTCTALAEAATWAVANQRASVHNSSTTEAAPQSPATPTAETEAAAAPAPTSTPEPLRPSPSGPIVRRIRSWNRAQKVSAMAVAIVACALACLVGLYHGNLSFSQRVVIAFGWGDPLATAQVGDCVANPYGFNVLTRTSQIDAQKAPCFSKYAKWRVLKRVDSLKTESDAMAVKCSDLPGWEDQMLFGDSSSGWGVLCLGYK
ncbi:serine/threonine-protein kinase [Nocardia sp. NPDC004722]